jgi:hypothetical protein
MCLRNRKEEDMDRSQYQIEVRARPVGHPLGQFVATHCYLALVDPDKGQVMETLSFDPSNSNGWSDAKPTDQTLGSRLVHTILGKKNLFLWSDLAAAFKQRAGSPEKYNLRTHNCCNAVMDALITCNGALMAGRDDAIEFARRANDTWANIHGVLPTSDYIKKND